MIVQIIGWFCLMCDAAMAVNICYNVWKSNGEVEYGEASLIFFVCLISASICFK